MPAGAVKAEAAPQAPPKTRRAFGALVVIDGALTEVDAPPLLWLAEALIGVEPAPEMSSRPPAISVPESPVNVNVCEAGSLDPATLYQAWIRTPLAFV